MNRNTRIVNQSAVPVSSPEKYEGRQFVTNLLFRIVREVCEWKPRAKHVCRILFSPFRSFDTLSYPNILEDLNSTRAEASAPFSNSLLALNIKTSDTHQTL